MTKGASIHQQQVYRFTRWSGKSYSAFNSIGKQVSIGVLSCVISNAMGVKSPVLSFYKREDIPDSYGEEEVVDDGFFSLILALLELLFLLLLGSVGMNLTEGQSAGSDQRLYFLSSLITFLLFPNSPFLLLKFSYTKSSLFPFRISIGDFFIFLKPSRYDFKLEGIHCRMFSLQSFVFPK